VFAFCSGKLRLVVLDFRETARPSILDLLDGRYDPNDRVVVEDVHQSWTAWLGGNYPDPEPLFLLQGRGTPRLVADSDVHPAGELHHYYHPLHCCWALVLRGAEGEDRVKDKR
jgi:hypothetical protein